MLLRLFVCLGLLADLASAETSPWDRLFQQPAFSAQEGIQSARDKAFARMPQTLPALGINTAKITPPLQQVCAAPLRELQANGHFAVRSLKGDNSLDTAIFHASSIPACKN